MIQRWCKVWKNGWKIDLKYAKKNLENHWKLGKNLAKMGGIKIWIKLLKVIENWSKVGKKCEN